MRRDEAMISEWGRRSRTRVTPATEGEVRSSVGVTVSGTQDPDVTVRTLFLQLVNNIIRIKIIKIDLEAAK